MIMTINDQQIPVCIVVERVENLNDIGVKGWLIAIIFFFYREDGVCSLLILEYCNNSLRLFFHTCCLYVGINVK